MTELPVIIPPGFTSAVTVGDTVKVGGMLAKRSSTPEDAINLAEKLEVSPKTVAKMLKKNPGDSVEVGDVLAVKSGFLSSTKVQSKVAGIVVRFERDSGNLVIQPKISEESQTVGDEVKAPVEGVISAVEEGKVSIKTEKNVLPVVRGLGETITAELYLLQGKGTEDLLYRLDADAIGKIVLSEKITRELLMKALGIGVAGLIVKDISETELQYYEEKEKHIPLVMVEKEAFEKIKKSQGKQVFVNGSEKVVVLLG